MQQCNLELLGTHKLLCVQGIILDLIFVEGRAPEDECFLGNGENVDEHKFLENVSYKSYIETVAQEGS